MAKDISRVTARDTTGIFRLCMSRLRLVAAITKRESYDPNTQELVLRPKLRKLKVSMTQVFMNSNRYRSTYSSSSLPGLDASVLFVVKRCLAEIGLQV